MRSIKVVMVDDDGSGDLFKVYTNDEICKTLKVFNVKSDNVFNDMKDYVLYHISKGYEYDNSGYNIL